MGKHVYGYWDCPVCGKKGIRGDHTTCPDCGARIAENVEYYMKEDVIEYVEEGKENKEANWICDYCGAQNSSMVDVCQNCGSNKHEATRNYFSKEIKDEKGSQEYIEKELRKILDSDADKKVADYSLKGRILSGFKSFFGFFIKKPYRLIYLILILFALSFVITIPTNATITGFRWERDIAIEEFNNYNEDAWELPAGANLHEKKREIHHYKKVIDHYETKTRTRTRRVSDGYTTEYVNKGNGQFETRSVPKYKTETYTETYQSPVYRDEPVYATRYYYDIDRWKVVSHVKTSADDHEPKWGTLPKKVISEPEKIRNPEYGYQREGEHTESYYLKIKRKRAKEKELKYDYNKWSKLKEGDSITYKERLCYLIFGL